MTTPLAMSQESVQVLEIAMETEKGNAVVVMPSCLAHPHLAVEVGAEADETNVSVVTAHITSIGVVIGVSGVIAKITVVIAAVIPKITVVIAAVIMKIAAAAVIMKIAIATAVGIAEIVGDVRVVV